MAGVSDQDLDSAFDAILGSLSTSSKPSATPAPVISPAPETPKAPTKPKASFEEIDALTSALLSPIVIKKAAAGARPPPATPNPRSPRHGGGIPSPRADQAAAVRPADASPGVTAGTISSPPPVSAPPPAALPPLDRGAAAQPEPGNSDAVAPALPSMDDMLNSFMMAAPPAAAKVPPSATLPPPTILPPPAIGLPPPAAGGLPPPSAGLPPPSGGLPPLQGGLLPPPDFLFLPPPPPPSEPEQEQGSPTGGAPPAVAAMRHPSPGRQSPASAAPPIHSSTLSKWLNKSSAGAKPPAAPADQASPGSPSTSASLTVPQQAPQQAGGAATGGSPPVASLVPSASTPSVSTIASPPPVAVSVSSPTLSGQAKAPAEALEPPRPAAQKTMLSATPPAKPSGTLQKTASGPLDAASVQPAAPSVTKQPVRPVSVFEPPNPAKAPNGVLPKSGSTGSLVPPAPTAPAGPPVVFAANKDELVVHDAVKSGQQARVMEVLAKHKSLINVRNSSEQSPLHVASQLGYQEIVNLLIANGAFLDAVDRSHWTAVHYASAGGHISTVRTLVTAGCSLGIRNDVGCTLLHYLMACGVPKTEKALFRIVVLEVVRAAGFDMNARNNAGSTALHQAAFRGKKWNMKVLLVHNPDVAVQTKLGETALHFAARRGDVKIVQMLLDKGASPDVKAETGTALDLAHAFKHEGVISVLTPVTSVPLTTVEATYEDIWRSQASLAETANRKPPTDTTRKQRGATEAGAVVVTPAEDEAHPPAQPQPQPHKSDKSNLLTRRLSTMFAKKEDVVAEQSHSPQPALRGSSPGSVESSSLAPEDKKAKAGLSKRLSMALFSDDKDKKEKKEKEKKEKDKEKKDKDDKEAREKEQQHKKDSAPASPAATAAAAPTPASASAAATTTAASPAAPSPTAAATPVDTDTVRRKKKGGMFGSLSQAFTGHGKDESKDIVFSNPVLVSSTLDLDAMPAKPRPMPAAEPPTPPVAKSETVARTNSVSSTPPAVASPLAASPSSPMNAQPATAGAPAPSAPPAVPALPPSAPTGVASPKSSRYNLHGASPRPGASIVDSLFRELDPSEREALIASPAFKRQKVLEEIINTEKEYVQDLESMINLFLLPLRTKNVIHTTDITDIFSNVETIFDVNTQLLASLTKGDPIGLAFLNMSEQLKNYSVYMANQDHSTASFERCKKTYPDLMPFLTSIFDANPQLRNSNLDNMLIKPVQRICKYPLLLDQLLKYTATTDADYDNIGRAKGAIEKVCEYIDVKILEYASRMKLKEIEPQIADLPEDFSIVPPEGSKQGRAYIKDWECKVSAKSDTRPSKIYLFDDMLLWTAAGLLDNMVGRNKKRLRYRDHVPYTEMLMKETNGQIVITHVGVREFTINPESEFDKEQMKNDIEKAADDLLKRNYNDIYGAIPESDRVSFADYKKNLQRQLEFIPLPVEMAKRGVSTRKENEVFALGAVALVSDLNSVTGTPPLPATSSPPSGHSGSTIISRTRDMSPAHVAAPLSLQAPLTVAQVQAAAAAARVPTAPAGARTKQLLNSSGSSGVAAPAPTAPANTSAAPSFQEGEEEVLEAR